MHPTEVGELTARPPVATNRGPGSPRQAAGPLKTSLCAGAVGIAVAGWSAALNLVGVSIPERAIGITSSLTTLIVAIGVGALCWRAALVRSGRWRTAWAAMGTGVWLFAIANLTSLDTAGTLFQTQEALHPFDDLAALAAAVSVWVALGAVPSKTRRWNNLRRLNSAILVVSAFTLIWVLAADTALSRVSGSARFGIVAGYIALDAITIAFAAATSSRIRLSNRADTRAMVIGAALLAISNLVTVLALIGQRSRLGEQVGLGVSVTALLLIGVGAGRARRGLTDGRPFGTRVDRFQRTAPVVAVIAAIVAVIIHEVLEGGDDPLSLTFGVVCVLLAALRLNMLERTQERLASELVEIAHRMETEANKDALTGLGNRAGLGIHLDNALNRQSQSGVSVFYIDIDHFKSVNDGLGHEAGDQLLVEIADRLSNVLGDDVFRIGGDEFVAVREDLNQVEAESVALALVASMEQPVHVLGRRMNAAVSVGLARSDLRRAPEPDPSSGWPTRRTDTADAVLRRADLALYRAKELGRGRWATYDPWLQQRADRQLQMQQGLYRALEGGEIDVFFQPVVELCSGEVVGAEALVRWHSPDHGLVLPNDFLPAAANAGLLPEIGAIVLMTVEERLRSAREIAAKSGRRPLWISVNLSPSEVSHPKVVERLVATAQQLETNQLHVGVKERSVIDSSSAEILQSLRLNGIRVLVEGFGSGPSSLRHLADYPADAVAVDRSFVDGLGEEAGDDVIVEAVATLASELSLTLVAEGVSNEWQAQKLRDLGYQLATGWHFGRPTTWEVFSGLHLADSPADRLGGTVRSGAPLS